MSIFTRLARDVFALHNADGSAKQPGEHAATWGTEIETIFTAVITAGGKLYTTKAAMDADTAPTINTPAIVLGDATVANNGLYRKSAAAGVAGWIRVGDVPGYSFITATNASAGTANAIVATTAIPIPTADGGALITLPIVATNTASPVTVAFNGGAALTIKTLAGEDVAARGFTAGMIVAGYKVGSTLRLLTHLNGWSPIFRLISDGARRVLELYDWTGGQGAKPATTGYVGTSGLTAVLADGVDVRGPAGPAGAGTGDMLASVYDPQEIEEDAFDCITRAVLVTRVSGGFVPRNGRIYRAGGLSYIGSTGATDISDLPGLLPFGDIFVQHFGIEADATYELQQIRNSSGTLIDAYGYVRTAGTDWHDLIETADAYAASVGKPLWFKNGSYYWLTEVEKTAHWNAETDFGVTLWPEYLKATLPGYDNPQAQSGVHIATSGAGMGIPGDHGFLIIPQFSSTTVKESGQGHLGAGIQINTYYSSTAQPIITDLHIRVKFCRAALQRDATGTITQRSISGMPITIMAGVEFSKFEIGFFGKTNVNSDRGLLAHWGCRYDPLTVVGGDSTTGDKTTAEIIESYHAINCELDFITEMDEADGHGLLQPFELAACGNWTVRGSYTIGQVGGGLGGALGAVTCGDVVNEFAVASQKEFVNKGMVIDRPVARDADGVLGSEHFHVKGMGTSKAIGDYEPGTTEFRQRQQWMEVRIIDPKIYYAAGAVASDQRSIFLDQIYGIVDWGELTSEGAHKAIEIEDCHGLFTGSVHGDGAVLNNFSSVTIWNVIDVDRGDEENAADTSNYASGWGSVNSRAVEILGTTGSLPNTDAEFTAGNTSISLASATTEAIHTGAILRVGTVEVVSTRMHCVGAVDIDVTPSPLTVASGASVTLVRQAHSKGPTRAAWKSSYNGMVVNNAKATDIWMDGIANCGRHAIKAIGSSYVEVGGEFPDVGRDSASGTSRRTIQAEDTSFVAIRNFTARAPAAVTSHVRFLESSSGSVSDGLISTATGFLATAGDAFDTVGWESIRDLETGAEIRHPGASATALPTLLIGGSSTGITYAAQAGEVTHIGNGLVYWSFDCTLSSRGGLTGNLTMVLPFEAAVDVYLPGQIFPFAGATADAHLAGNAGTTMTFQRQSTSGVSTLTHADITDASRFRFAGVYRRV